jgi:AraC-like DNA-binding protein
MDTQIAVDKPLANYRLFDTRDVDEARYEVSRVYCEHKLQPARKKNLLDACHHHAPFGDISLNYMQYGPQVTVEPGYLREFYLLQLPLRGSAQIRCDDHQFHTNESIASVINPDAFTSMVWSDDCAKLLVQIKKTAVDAQLARMLGQPVEHALVFDHTMESQNPQHAAWWRSIGYVVNELSQQTNCYQNPMVRDDLVKSIISGLISSVNNNYSETLLGQDKTIAPKHVRMAERYVQENYRTPITIDDLTKVTGVSARCLFEGFKNFRSTTPMKYLLQVRLARAHDACLHADKSQSVTQIATDHGFTQLGRFSIVYKQVFGESPSDTLKTH